MLKFIFSLGLVFSVAHAEEKTCAVKGMHCDACTEMVQTKVCVEGKYSKCDVKIIDEKKELGQVHLVTKDDAGKIDEGTVGAAVKDAGYTLDKCKAGKAKAESKKAKG
jgi:hypothetical protein